MFRADHTGAVWCYVDQVHSQSSCQDLDYGSVRFPGKPWSYEACATSVCGPSSGHQSLSGPTGPTGQTGPGRPTNCRGSNCGPNVGPENNHRFSNTGD